jgi:1,4-dihydroxy-2-naphthoyl-CoA synthase
MQQYIQVRNGKEAQEGIKAFIEKRKPAWEKSWKLHL